LHQQQSFQPPDQSAITVYYARDVPRSGLVRLPLLPPLPLRRWFVCRGFLILPGEDGRPMPCVGRCLM
jgi:hypothetical protein